MNKDVIFQCYVVNASGIWNIKFKQTKIIKKIWIDGSTDHEAEENMCVT